MKNDSMKPREPTETKLTNQSKASVEQRKKLYRKRTMDEVRKSIHFAENTYDDGNLDNQDPAQKTVDTAIDSARTAGDIARDRIHAYSDKLKTRTSETGGKRSDALKSEVEKAKDESIRNSADLSESVGKKIQKKRIKKEYAKAAREAKKTASGGKTAGNVGKKLAEKGGDLASAIIEKVGKFVSEHPLGCALAALIFIVVVTVVGCIGSLGALLGGPNNGVLGTSFTARDSDLCAVENAYSAKESDLQTRINNIETTYSGYDEYKYDLDTIRHDPYQLAAYLTIKYDDYELRDVSSELTSLFNSQYSLTTNRVVETRYRTEERTGYSIVYDYDEDGNVIGYHYEPYTYYVQVAYSYYILEVTLDNSGLDSLIRSRLSDEELTRYEAMLALKGGKPDLW